MNVANGIVRETRSIVASLAGRQPAAAPRRSRRSPFVALALCLWLVLPLLLTSPTDENVLMLSMVWALAALSLNIIWGYGGQFSMAQVVLGAVSAYSYAILAVKAGWPISLALAGAVVITVMLSVLIALASMRLEGFRFAIMTLAFALAGVGLASSWSLTGQTEGLEVPTSWAVINIGPIHWDLTGRDGGFTILASLVFFILIAAFAFILRTRYGRRLLAIREDRLLANSLGISPSQYRILVFALSAVAAAAAGIFQAQYYAYISPDFFSFTTLVNTIVVLVLGGPGRLLGPLVGGIVYAVLSVALPISGDVQSIVFGAAIIGLTIFAREGLAYYLHQGQSRLWNSLSRRTRRPRSTAPIADGQLSEEGIAAVTQSLPIEAAEPGANHRQGGEAILHASDLLKAFGGVTAVDGLSFEIRSGTVFGVIGPNGAGKTTALNLMSGFVAPDAGVVTWDGRDITRLSPAGRARRGLVRTFQQPRTFGKLSVRENVAIAGQIRSGQSDASDEILEQFGLARFAELPAASLSYGSAKRLGVAMAAATGAEMIMLDEPAAGLNAADIVHMVADLRWLQSTGRTLCLVEHHMDMITALCDLVLVLDAGRLLLVDVPGAVINDPRVIEAYLGGAP